jgi:pyrroline-5-carboxylate reductase
VSDSILLVGAGRMGGALLKGWIRAGIEPIVVVEPNSSGDLRKIALAGGAAIHADVEDVPDRIRACVVALKPQVLKTEGARLGAVAQSGALMISIAAGTSIGNLTSAWGKGTRIVRAMPNTPGAIGRGVTALYAPKNTREEDRKLAGSLLGPLGDTLWVKREALVDSVTAVSGSGPAYVFLLVEALADAAEHEGLPRGVAETLARATVIGAGALLDADQRAPSDLRKDVTSPGGTTEAALKILMSRGGLKPLVARAVRAARKRANALSR